ncbi:hypothetical protein [Arthrobacter glacialis]|uniref:Uncharacterized protein n=1 Tax=Arthrobacter glacialis TaxID=1664 RepID=A0A2S3ZU87_ARTGL|nr:hypothetical protein [Arthrobacter glacialis]POH72649.1 hypothetical protein CVS27_14860 [Arthrobacter glacialis]
MNAMIQKFLALFSTTQHGQPESVETQHPHSGMPLASGAYLREFAQRLGLEVDDLSPAEQTELKVRLDKSMDFREENYGFLYHEVYQLGHGYSLADASRVSAQINSITEDPAARAFLDYRENAVAAEALMAAGSLLEKDGDDVAAARLFKLAEARRHRSSVLETNGTDVPVTEIVHEDAEVTETVALDVVAEGPAAPDRAPESGLAGLMEGPAQPAKPTQPTKAAKPAK